MTAKRRILRTIFIALSASAMAFGCQSPSEPASKAQEEAPQVQGQQATDKTAEQKPADDNTVAATPSDNKLAVVADPESPSPKTTTATPGGSTKNLGGHGGPAPDAEPAAVEPRKTLGPSSAFGEESDEGERAGAGKGDAGFGAGGEGRLGKTKMPAGLRGKDGWSGDPAATPPGGWDRPPEKPVVRAKPKLTAGETDDNDNFDGFEKFLAERPKAYLEEMDVSERMFIRVLDAKNRPLPNTQVVFKTGGQEVFTGMTYADGWLLFHPKSIAAASQAQSFDLSIGSGQSTLDYTIKRGAKEKWEVRMPAERAIPARPQLDVVFLLDTTGSMGDEIERLQSTILDISDKVSSLPGNPEARFGLVLYRDDGEEYVSELHNFTADVNEFKQTLSKVTADGGGDTPERLEVGLHRTVHEMTWAPKSTRLVFLVADAPPHRSDQNEFSYSRDVQAAVGKGIKIYPVASSGLNDDGEYVLRQLAQYTMAKFLFLTYGAGGDFTPHDIPKDSFQPTTLDGLITKIIRSEIQSLELDKGGFAPEGQ